MSRHLVDDHPAVGDISFIGTQSALALEVAAALLLCGLNT